MLSAITFNMMINVSILKSNMLHEVYFFDNDDKRLIVTETLTEVGTYNSYVLAFHHLRYKETVFHMLQPFW